MPSLKHSILTAGSAMILLSCANSVLADAPAQKTATKTTSSTNKPAEKWATDENLRQGMERLRQTMQAQQLAIEQDRLSSAEYRQLAEAVEKAITHILQTCKLSPQTDKALHTVVLTDLHGGVQMMQTSPKTAAQRVGAMAVLQALRK